MQWFLDDWAPDDLRSRIAVLDYDEAADLTPQPGAVIFADLERLDAEGLSQATALWQRLSEAEPRMRLLNHPARSARRYQLLRRLHTHGINRHNAYRLSELATPATPPVPEPPGVEQVRFPVFLREERDHTGSMSRLLHSWADLHGAAHDLIAGSRWGWDDLLAVEYCDTSTPDGIFATFRAFVVGERVLPAVGGLTYARSWEEKGYTLPEDHLVQRSIHYAAGDPHARRLGEVARLAGVDYGRFDYGLLDGRPEIWELNTNPNVIVPRAAFEQAGRSFEGDREILAALRRAEMAALQSFAAALRALGRPGRTARVRPGA